MRISDLCFQIDDSSLTASIEAGSLVWALSISAAPRELCGEIWHPRAYSESLLEIEGQKLIEWHLPFESELRWKEGYNTSRQRPNALLATFEHTEIYDSVLKVDAKPSGELDIVWSARCDVFLDHTKRDLNWKYTRNPPGRESV